MCRGAKYIRNFEKENNTCNIRHLAHQLSNPAYYIEDWPNFTANRYLQTIIFPSRSMCFILYQYSLRNLHEVKEIAKIRTCYWNWSSKYIWALPSRVFRHWLDEKLSKFSLQPSFSYLVALYILQSPFSVHYFV